MSAEMVQRAACLEGNSTLHRTDARVKIALLLIYLLTTALLPIGAWAVYLLMAGLLAIAMLLSELPLRTLVKRSFLIEVPILLVLLPQIFLRRGDFIEVQFAAGLQVSLSLTGIERVASLLVRSWLSVQFAVLITAVTRFEDMLVGLRACGLPRLLTAILGLMWRYLFIMMNEVECMQQARAARSAGTHRTLRRAGNGIVWRATVTGNMAGVLLLRSIRRSERIYQAMQSRGYDGEIRMDSELSLTSSQRLLILTFIAAGLLFILIAFGMVD